MTDSINTTISTTLTVPDRCTCPRCPCCGKLIAAPVQPFIPVPYPVYPWPYTSPYWPGLSQTWITCETNGTQTNTTGLVSVIHGDAQ